MPGEIAITGEIDTDYEITVSLRGYASYVIFRHVSQRKIRGIKVKCAQYQNAALSFSTFRLFRMFRIFRMFRSVIFLI